MDPQVSALQNAINRFAAVGGFAKVAVDGLWGTQTKQGVYSALSFVGQGKCYKSACPDDDMAKTAAGIMAQWDESMNAAGGIGQFLAGAADELGIPHVASPITTPSGGGAITVVPAQVSVSLYERWNMLPIWKQILITIGVGVSALFVAKKLRRA